MKMKEKHPNYKYVLKEIQYIQCMICDKNIKIDGPDDYHKIEELISHDGIIEKMYAGYGSKFDGDIFYVGICDECLEKKKKQGRILTINNYMGKIDLQEENKEFLKNRIRNKKIKKILNNEN